MHLIATASGETAMPTWAALLFLLIPVTLVLVLMWKALRGRGKLKRANRAQRAKRGRESVALGTSASIDDGAAYQEEALLKAMSVRPEDHGPAGGLPHNEGWRGTMLGLKSRISASTTVLEPHVYWGERAHGQVFVRTGPDEKIEGGTMLMSNRHIRSISVLRVAAPEFGAAASEGRVEAGDGAPPELTAVLGRLSTSPDIWDELVIYGGPAGIVAARPAADGRSMWIYDLWLLERIATDLKLDALPKARVGPAWKVPYGLGRSSEPKLETAKT